MKGFGEKKIWILHTVLVITIIIGLVFVSGCQNLNLGGTQVADFGGNSPNAQEMQRCFFSKYGDPAAYAGPPRFLEPMVSDGISDNLPTDKVTAFSKDTPTVYVWAFYEGFKQGDTITAVWTFNGQQYASLSKQVAGNYGIVYGQFNKPNSGWALGTHTITISGNGIQGSATFDIIDGQTRTVPLPCQEAGGQVQETPVVTPVTTPPLAVSLVTTIQTPVKALWTQPKLLALPKAEPLHLPHADYPEMSGDVIVWGDYRNSNRQGAIYMYSIATKTESLLIVSKDTQQDPEISGDLITYVDFENEAHITVYDLKNKIANLVPSSEGGDNPDIDGNRIVWGNNGNIYMYDRSTGLDALIMAGGRKSRISGDNIIYLKSVNNRGDIYLYNIPSKKETCISCGLAEQPNADYRIDGNYVVFSMSTAGEPLRLYNIGTKTTSTIVPCPGKCDYQTDGVGGAYYDISGTKVVYTSGVDCSDCDIEEGLFIYDISAGTTKALHLHYHSDSESLGTPNGGYPRISGNNVIFWQGFEDLYLIKL